MDNRPNIVLIGFMGTGKTTAGRALAARLGLTFVDMDAVIEERAGKPIPRLFAEEGEPRFRERERDVVRDLAARRGLVIGTGGGVVLNPDNVRDLGASGLMVCLSADPEVIHRRTAGEQHRPLIEHADKFARITEILERRRPLYAAIPHQVDTTALAPEEVADRIERLYRQFPREG
jgi:shikimate kinase